MRGPEPVPADVVRGVRLGIDPGDARIGVAASDPSAFLATPVETVARGKGDLDRLAGLVDAHGAVLLYVGLPRSLSGGEGPAAGRVRAFAAQLAARVAPVPVRLYDERLSTVSAEAMLRQRGRKGKKRRAVVDQAAAVVILQAALDTERSTGLLPGEQVTVPAQAPKEAPDASADKAGQQDRHDGGQHPEEHRRRS